LLLIEDELAIRRFLRASLTAENLRLVEAESGAQALRLAAQQPPDLVILDLGLPDVDGQEVLKQLREWLHAPIIVLSARDQEAQKIAALDHGADDYLTNPHPGGAAACGAGGRRSGICCVYLRRFESRSFGSAGVCQRG
jgi:two-component system KDP operon response regulator KdpE